MEPWNEISKRLSDEEPLMLIIVTDIQGSSPGKPGFKMLVGPKGPVCGSVGGGVMEYNMVSLAQQAILSNNQDVFMKVVTHSKDGGEKASGLICAGSQSQVFIPIAHQDRHVVDHILMAMQEGKSTWIAITGKGMAIGLPDTRDSLDLLYKEEIKPPETVYLFGGGHISLPLSQVCHMLGFRVVVLDDRPSLSTMENNKYAHLKKRIDYAHAALEVIYPETAYVCIMTVSHESDKNILAQMLELPLRYLGMIGSRNKIKQVFSALRERGFSEESLHGVDSPMGIPIGAVTPAEIAVSIAAGMLSTKNKDIS